MTEKATLHGNDDFIIDLLRVNDIAENLKFWEDA